MSMKRSSRMKQQLRQLRLRAGRPPVCQCVSFCLEQTGGRVEEKGEKPGSLIMCSLLGH